MKNFNKKAIVGIVMVAILFIGGITIGALKHTGTASTVSIAQDTSYDKLLSDVEYSIPKKDIVKNDKKIEAKFNVVAKDLTPEQVKTLAKNIYETTMSKQRGLTSVQVDIFNEWDKASDLISGFYTDGLKCRVTFDNDFNGETMLSYINIPGVKQDVKQTDWEINNIFNTDGLVKVEIAISDGTKDEEVMSQTKGLLDQIKALNPTETIDAVEANITSTGTNGWAYNSKFEDILAKVEKSSIK